MTGTDLRATHAQRTRAVVALAMAVQRSSLDLWCGRSLPWEERREAAARTEPTGASEASDQCPHARLVDAVRAMVEAISEVVSHPGR